MKYIIEVDIRKVEEPILRQPHISIPPSIQYQQARLNLEKTIKGLTNTKNHVILNR